MALPLLPSSGSVPEADGVSKPSWRFEISLAGDEATVVSFKKLVKDAERAQRSHGDITGGFPSLSKAPSAGEGQVAPLPLAPHPAAPPGRDLAGDGLPAPANRFSSVIERIERLYTGHQSDEEEDSRLPATAEQEQAGPRPKSREDDFYDTDDSFIDDDDLDAYFSDQGEPEHQGFVVTKGALKPRPTLEADGRAPVPKRKKKRPRIQEAANGGEGVEKAKKAGITGEAGKPKQPKRAKEKEAGATGPAAKAGKKEKGEGGSGKLVKKAGEKGASTAEPAALVLPASAMGAEAAARDGLGGGDLSKGPAKSEAAEGPLVVGKKGGKKALLADKVAIALQVSKDREAAQHAAKKEADAKRALKRKSEGKKKKSSADGEGSTRAPDAPQVEAARGSVLSGTASGLPIGLLNAEVSNARTLGGKQEAKKRLREEDASNAEAEASVPLKKVKKESWEGGGEDGASPKVRKARPTDMERLDAAIAELKASVDELCPPEAGKEGESSPGGEEEGEEGGKKRRLPTATQAALFKIAKVAGMRKGSLPPDLVPRLLPIVGHVFKGPSLRENLKRKLAKALEAKKGGATTPQKDTSKQKAGGTPRRKEEGAKKKEAEAVGIQGTQELPGGTQAGHGTEGQRESGSQRPGAERSNGVQGKGEEKAEAVPKKKGSSGAGVPAHKLAEARRLLEELVQKRIEARKDSQGGQVAVGDPASLREEELGFDWDHPTENALLAVSRLAREGGSEKNGQVAKQLYKDIAQLWTPGQMDVASLQKAVRRAKARVENKKPSTEGSGGSAKKEKQDGDLQKRAVKAPTSKGGAATSTAQVEQEERPMQREGAELEGVAGQEQNRESHRPAEVGGTHALPSVFKDFQASEHPSPLAVK